MSNSYLSHPRDLAPPGLAWPRKSDSLLSKVFAAWAAEMERSDERARQVVEESEPRTALEMISDWERVCGLPDTCSSGVATTIQERRLAVTQKLTAIGGASKSYFIDLAERLGYTIEIDEFRPFVCGLGRCGDQLNGGHSVRYSWRVRVIGPRYVAFRTGVSQCGDLLGKVVRAQDLECKLRRLKPAHTNLIFSYDGV